MDKVYFPCSQKGLRGAYQVVKGELDKLEIPHVTPKAGVFVWIDLSKVCSRIINH